MAENEMYPEQREARLAAEVVRLTSPLAAAQKVANHLLYLGIALPEPTRRIAIRVDNVMLVLEERGESMLSPASVQQLCDDIDAYMQSKAPPAPA
jgi:hypothetical protein